MGPYPSKERVPKKKESISYYEWFLIIAILGFIASVSLKSLINSADTAEIIQSEDLVERPLKKIQVVIEGAVKKPGVYTVTQGTCLKKVLKQAKTTKQSDLKSLNLEKKIEVSERIFIPERENITIFILRDEKKEILQVPLNTRVCHLKKWIHTENKDCSKILKSKRLLKDGEEIFIK